MAERTGITNGPGDRRWAALLGGAAGGAFVHLSALSWGLGLPTAAGALADTGLASPIRNSVLALHLILLTTQALTGALWALPVALAPPPRGWHSGFALGAGACMNIMFYGMAAAPAWYVDFHGLGSWWAWSELLTQNPILLLAPIAPVIGVVLYREMRARAFTSTVVLLVLTISFAWVLTFREEPGAPSPAPGDKPDLLILAATGLNADDIHAAAEGDPDLAQFLDDSIAFEEAYSPSTDATATLVSALTGAPPWANGVHGPWVRRSRPTTPRTLPEYARTLGYSTSFFADRTGQTLLRLDLGFHRVSTPRVDARTLALSRALTSCPDILPWLLSDVRFAWAVEARRVVFGGDPDGVVDDVLRFLAKPAFEPRLVVVAVGDGGGASSLAEISRVVAAVRNLPPGKIRVALLGLPLSRGTTDPSLIRRARVPLIVFDPERPNAGRSIYEMVMVTDLAASLLSPDAIPPDWPGGVDLIAVANGTTPGRDRLFVEAGFDPERWPNAPTSLDLIWSPTSGAPVLRPDAAIWIDLMRERALFDGRHEFRSIPTEAGVRYELYDVVYDADRTRDIAQRQTSLTRRLSEALTREWTEGGRFTASRGYLMRTALAATAPKAEPTPAPTPAQEPSPDSAPEPASEEASPVPAPTTTIPMTPTPVAPGPLPAAP